MDPISRLCRALPAACRDAGLPAQAPGWSYRADGPPHCPTFRATCTVPRGPELGWPAVLEGPPAGTKAEARQAAAAAVLEAVGRPADPPAPLADDPDLEAALRTFLLEGRPRSGRRDPVLAVRPNELEDLVASFKTALRALEPLSAGEVRTFTRAKIDICAALGHGAYSDLVTDYLAVFLDEYLP